jgi:hypothetical protein
MKKWLIIINTKQRKLIKTVIKTLKMIKNPIRIQSKILTIESIPKIIKISI